MELGALYGHQTLLVVEGESALKTTCREDLAILNSIFMLIPALGLG